ncbi:MAG TPA: BTAD domain-containing putative transcriptional regulator [Solirubrobacteraceae bacterium]|nr:BTAD domain-containing putative transcriptional regulator [Solirubrobacteraceae bacterium]
MSAVTHSADTTRLDLLDGFRLRQGSAIIRLQPGVQRLVAFLALHDRPLQRLYVAGRLWTDASQEAANANLRTALWRMRHPSCRLVEASVTVLALDPAVVVDLREATQRARRVLAGHHEAGDLAALISAGELLPDLYDDWVMIERERFRQLRLHALERLCEECRDAGRFAEATEAGLAAVATEPLRESAHRALICSHLAEGNAGEAARQYRVYRDLARDELGVEPSSRLRALVGTLAAG